MELPARLIDILCPICLKVCGALLSGGCGSYRCKGCKVEFIARVDGLTLLTSLGEPYRRGRPSDMIRSDKPLLPKIRQRGERPEIKAILPIQGVTIDV
jgi:hypothetical protein